MAEEKYVITSTNKKAFLDAYMKCGTVYGASKLSGVSMSTHYFWRDSDEHYKALCELAADIAVDRLEHEAYKRARGYTEQGKRKSSDLLMMFLLKGAKPAKYRDNGHQITVNNNQVQLQGSNLLEKLQSGSLASRLIGKVALEAQNSPSQVSEPKLDQEHVLALDMPAQGNLEARERPNVELNNMHNPELEIKDNPEFKIKEREQKRKKVSGEDDVPMGRRKQSHLKRSKPI